MSPKRGSRLLFLRTPGDARSESTVGARREPAPARGPGSPSFASFVRHRLALCFRKTLMYIRPNKDIYIYIYIYGTNKLSAHKLI